MIERICKKDFESIEKGAVHVIYGPRRSGKTTFVKNILSKYPKSLYGVGDDIYLQNILSSNDQKLITSWAEGYELIVIDEAQYIPNIGQGLKLLVDSLPELKIIATGSSSFDLSQKIGEPLTGRKKTYYIFPFSYTELVNAYVNPFELNRNLEEILIYGSYPGTFLSKTIQDKKEYLNELTSSYLLKDILALENIKSSKVLIDLVKLLAFQIGSEVSMHELATKLWISSLTVTKYIDLLIKSFVLFELSPYQSNKRNSIGKKSKYYFVDLGIRNTVINNFNNIDTRDDIGALRENFVIVEMIKKNLYKRTYLDLMFWRWYQTGEVDLITHSNTIYKAYECKRNSKKSSKIPNWLELELSSYDIINKDNYQKYLL